MPVTSIFSFSRNAFYSINDRNYHLCHVHFVVCKCLQFGQGQIFVVWEWVKPFKTQSRVMTTLIIRAFGKLPEKEKMSATSQSSFSQNFSILSKTNSIIWAKFEYVKANAFNFNIFIVCLRNKLMRHKQINHEGYRPGSLFIVPHNSQPLLNKR